MAQQASLSCELTEGMLLAEAEVYWQLPECVDVISIWSMKLT